MEESGEVRKAADLAMNPTRCFLQLDELFISKQRSVVDEFEGMRRVAHRAERRLGNPAAIDLHLHVKGARDADEVRAAHLGHDQRRSNDHAAQAHQFIDV